MRPVTVIGIALLAGCASAPPPAPVRKPIETREAPRPPADATAPLPPLPTVPTLPPPPAPGAGAYYLDDGPGSISPAELEKIPDAKPKPEPLHRFANNPYSALGQEFVPDKNLRAYRQRGLASWYGRRFHGRKTASGEVYDMYQMTAAHPTLPIPSYVKVTNVGSAKSVVVRVNDRGPFLRGRIIDLSYAAAAKLGYVEQGSVMVEVESVHPEDGTPLAARPRTLGEAAVQPPRGTGYPVYQEPDGLFVQLGAFTSADNAESLRARLQPIALLESRRLVLIEREGLHRLFAGPYATRADALSAGVRLATEVR